MTEHSSKGFSLVELSIILVILGLLVGGILAGQSLIRAAELRAVSTEYNRYTIALQAFRDKYFQLPGDMNNATKFWGTAANCPGTAAQGSTAATTCDGDNNGQISNSGTAAEWARAWQHLANAGLIEGSYSGVTGSDSYSWNVVSSNSPTSKISDGLWTLYYMDNSAGTFTGSMFSIHYQNGFVFGAQSGIYWNATGILTPEEAWNIDTKLDDGQPARGKIIASYSPTCTTAANAATFTGSYALTTTTKNCFLMFRNAI